MARPHLDSAAFPTLLSGAGQVSNGTVTGTHINEHDGVDIVGSGSRAWHGEVTSRASGSTWNATVTRLTSIAKAPSIYKESSVKPLPEPDATETLDVTVTNNDGTSNKVPSDADVV